MNAPSFRLLFLVTSFLLCLSLVGCIGTPQVPVSGEQANMALNEAYKHLGKPYEYGARGPNKFDCSGLITYSYRSILGDIYFNDGLRSVPDVGIFSLRKYATDSVLQPLPGDIVFIKDAAGNVTHGGLVISLSDQTLKFINASGFYGRVVIDEWPVDSVVRNQRVESFGRLKIALPNNR